MPFEPFKLFSRRLAEAKGELPDVFEYDTLPTAFRNQVSLVLRDLMLKCSDDLGIYSTIEKEVSKGLGLAMLGGSNSHSENVLQFIGVHQTGLSR